MKAIKIIVIATLFLCSCTLEEKNVSTDKIKEKLVNEIKLNNPVVIDLKDNQWAGERYGISVAKIEEGFVYTSGYDAESADEIVVVKSKDKKGVIDLESSLEREVTNMLKAWEDVSNKEYKKIQNHKILSKGNYTFLVISDKNKEAEKIFESFFEPIHK